MTHDELRPDTGAEFREKALKFAFELVKYPHTMHPEELSKFFLRVCRATEILTKFMASGEIPDEPPTNAAKVEPTPELAAAAQKIKAPHEIARYAGRTLFVTYSKMEATLVMTNPLGGHQLIGNCFGDVMTVASMVEKFATVYGVTTISIERSDSDALKNFLAASDKHWRIIASPTVASR